MTPPAPASRQTLLLFKGHPATGKSTLAGALARRLAWPLLDKDDIKDHLQHLPDSGALSYDVLWQIARHQLEIGLSIIVDSTLSYARSYENGLALANVFGARVLVVETSLPEEAWKARLDQRLSQPRNHRTAGWEAMQALLGDYDSSWAYEIPAELFLSVDTSQPTDHLLQIIVDRLNEPA